MGEQSNTSKAAGYGAAWSVFGVLLSGMLAWGGIGWLVDYWLDLGFFLPTGLIIGSVAGVYLAYRRFGVVEQPLNSSTNDGDDDTATAGPPPRS